MGDRVVIEVDDVTTGYGTKALAEHVSFQVREGEVFGLLGGSGCGKSTLLKHMIGLVPPLKGSIRIEGHDIVEASGDARDEILRRIGVMYQQGALFGSMTLLENVCLPLEGHTRLPAPARERIAASKLALVALAGYEGYYPDEISGGMRKRAAIARAMALDPGIIFLDEPSAGLDPITSAELDELIRRLKNTLGTTFVMVTHELPSIFSVVDRTIVLDKKAMGVVAEGDPRVLRDTSTVPSVHQFFHRQATATQGATS